MKMTLGMSIWDRKPHLGKEKDSEQWFTRRMDPFTLALGSKMKSMAMGCTALAKETAMEIFTKVSFETINKLDMDFTFTSKDMSMMESGEKIRKRVWEECSLMMARSTMDDGLKIRWMGWEGISTKKVM